MRAELISAFFLCFDIGMQELAFSQTPEGQLSKAEMSHLQNRIETGEQSAFEAAAKLPINEAVGLLGIYALDASNDKARAERAREVLRKLPELTKYMKQRVLRKRVTPSAEHDVVGDFDLLAVIGDDSAAAATAAFLFVDDPVVFFDNQDYSVASIKQQAAIALTKMQLPDGLPGKKYYDFGCDDIAEWKAWAIERGYRDSSIPALVTLRERGLTPSIIAQSEALQARAKAGPPAPATPLPSAAGSLQIPVIPNGSPALPVGVSRTPAVPSERSAPVWPWVVGIAALIAVVAFALKRRA